MKQSAFAFCAATALTCVGMHGACAKVVLFGAHVGRQFDPNWKADLENFERDIGRKLDIDNDQEDWAVMPNSPRIRWDIANHRLPMISWTIAFHKATPERGCATARAILSGTYDRQIDQQARAVKAFAVPILIRFNYEMTGTRVNACFQGFDVEDNPGRAGSTYVSVWKYVVNRFRSAGANNVKWVWAPGEKAYETGRWRLFYPGGGDVDWIGIDDYNKGDRPRSFADDPGISAFYSATSGMGKPLMVAETGAVSDPDQKPDPQTLWLTTAHAYLKTHPAIKAFVWWNNPGKLKQMNPDFAGAGYVLDGPGLSAFKAMANDPALQ